MIRLLIEYFDCFAWGYMEMPSLSRKLIEHRLPIKPSFGPFKQRPRPFCLALHLRIKDKIHRLLEANFIRSRRCADWVSDIVRVEKKDSGKLIVRIDFLNLNRVTPKDKYPMPVVGIVINNALGNRFINFLDGNVEYNQIFMAE